MGGLPFGALNAAKGPKALTRLPTYPLTLVLEQSHFRCYSYGLMFDELSSKLNATLQRLTGRGVLTEDAVKEGLREIRRILLEADVSFDLTRDFLTRVQEKAVGVLSIKEVRPGHQLVKIVYDELVALLGEKQA